MMVVLLLDERVDSCVEATHVEKARGGDAWRVWGDQVDEEAAKVHG